MAKSKVSPTMQACFELMVLHKALERQPGGARQVDSRGDRRDQGNNFKTPEGEAMTGASTMTDERKALL